MKNSYSDYNGMVFGHWTVIQLDHIKRYVDKNKKKSVKPYIKALCNLCGKEWVIGLYDVTKGKSKRCSDCRKRALRVLAKTLPKTGKGKKNPNWKGGNLISGRFFTQIKSNAIVRDLDFDLDFEYLENLWREQKQRCAITGVELVMPYRENKKIPEKFKNRKFASLDRKDNTLGYLKGNVQWVAKNVNIMKMALTFDEFLSLVKSIYLFNKDKIDNLGSDHFFGPYVLSL